MQKQHLYVFTPTWLTTNGKEKKFGRVTIKPETFCYLKEIELKITKLQLKSKQ